MGIDIDMLLEDEEPLMSMLDISWFIVCCCVVCKVSWVSLILLTGLPGPSNCVYSDLVRGEATCNKSIVRY